MNQREETKKRMSKRLKGIVCLLLCVLLAMPAVPVHAEEKLSEYDMVSSFSDGLAVVQKEMAQGKAGWSTCGYINKKGNLVIKMMYSGARDFSEGLALVTNGGKNYYINKKGKTVIMPSNNIITCGDFSEGLASVTFKNGKHGYINKKGKTAIKLSGSLEHYGSFSNGLAQVREPDGEYSYKFGYINKKGKLVIPAIYKSAEAFQEGLACVEDENNKYGFIDKKGNQVVEPQYDGARSFSEGLAAVCKDEKWGFIDKTGKEVIELKYNTNYGTRFSEGVATVRDGDDVLLIDQTGKSVGRVKNASWVKPLSDGLGLVEKSDVTGCYVNKKGKVVIKGGYDSSYAYDFSEGLACVRKNGKWYYINTKGKVVIK